MKRCTHCGGNLLYDTQASDDAGSSVYTCILCARRVGEAVIIPGVLPVPVRRTHKYPVGRQSRLPNAQLRAVRGAELASYTEQSA